MDTQKRVTVNGVLLEGYLPAGNEVMLWTIEDVGVWLKKANLSDLVPVFQKRSVDGAALLSLTEEQLLFWSEIKISHKKQITKYINHCKEEMTFQNARKRLLSVTKKNQPPPAPVPADYVAGNYSDNEEEADGWDTDFDEVSDDDDDFDKRNDYNSSQLNDCINPTIPLTHNVASLVQRIQQSYRISDVKLDRASRQPSKGSHPGINLVSNGISENEIGSSLQLPPCPVIPKRLPKPWESPASGSSSDQSETSKPKPPSPVKPQVQPKPAIFNNSVGTVTKRTTINRSPGQGVIPRPPGTIPARASQRLSTCRPTDQPPPPPVKHKLPELNTEEEYEIPCASSDVASTSSNASSSLHDQGGENYETIDQVKDSIPSDVSDTCSLDRQITRQFSFTEQPSLPPRRPSGTPLSLTAPPLPMSPKPSTSPQSLESPINKPKLKPIPLPTRTDSSGDEKVTKKDGPVTFAKKFSSIWPRRDPDKSKSERLSNGANQCEQIATSPAEATSTLTKAKSLSRIHSSQSSIDDSCTSVQKRPLPPVPDPLGPASRRPSLPTLVDSSSRELMDNFAWYHSVEREVAELKLKEQGSNGSYLVRPSRRAGESSPYTLSILSENRVFHLNIRRISNSRYALGKEKYNEKTFNSVEELIAFHQVEPILLTSGGNAAGCTKLMHTPTRR